MSVRVDEAGDDGSPLQVNPAVTAEIRIVLKIVSHCYDFIFVDYDGIRNNTVGLSMKPAVVEKRFSFQISHPLRDNRPLGSSVLLDQSLQE